ncbi:MAG: hypothetical protein GYB64_14875 [Chloroflexi bacterium]|nr:hypothetical protein [Chloroflexota bacterium]
MLIAAAAGLLRFTHLDWDAYQNHHPDERGILFVAQTAGENPNPLREPDGSARYYAYGHTHLYLIYVTERLTCPHCDPLLRFQRLTVAARALSAAFDTLTVVATALIGRRLFGDLAGLAAGAALAFAVLHVQQAHFGTVDTGLTFFCSACIGVLVSDLPSRRRALVAGLCLGAACGFKLTGALLVIPAAVALAPREMPWFAGAAGVLFAATNPYALLDAGIFLTSLSTQGAMVRGRLDVAFTRQYTGTLPVLYGIEQQIRWTLGPALTVLGYAGLIGAAGTGEDHHRPVWVWALVILLVSTVPMVKFPRYTLPLTPMLALGAAWLVAQPKASWARFGLAALLLVPTAFSALGFSTAYRSAHPWNTASDWIYRHIPAGSALVTAMGDAEVPAPRGDLLAANRYALLPIDPFAEPDDPGKIEQMAMVLAQGDYLVVASSRHYGVIPGLPDRYPQMGAFYRALFAGDLGYRVEAIVTRDGTLPCVEPPCPDQSLRLYDRPTVIVLRNVERLPAETIQARAAR